MDIRRLVLKFSPLILFTLYFYTLCLDYFKYGTVTNVDKIRRVQDMPPIKYIFCIHIGAIYYGDPNFYTDRSSLVSNTFNQTYINIKLFRNEHPVLLIDDPFILANAKCWDVKYNISKNEIRDEIFSLSMLEFIQSVKGAAFISRNLISRYQYEAASPVALFVERIGSTKMFELYVLKQLEPPYDTMCHNYNISQDYCYALCENNLQKHLNSTIYSKCLDQCTLDDCIKLITYYRYTETPQDDSNLMLRFGSE